MKTSIKLDADLQNLRALKSHVLDFLNQLTVDFKSEFLIDFELAVEELVVNVIEYAYPKEAGDIELVCAYENNTITVEIIDSGLPFDPTQAAAPNLEQPIEERAGGGMGIFLVKQLVDKVTYKRENNQNILTLSVTPPSD